MNVIFRSDASSKIGAGHITRCLSLARYLRSLGHNCKFICRVQKNNLIEKIKKEKFEVFPLRNSQKKQLTNNQINPYLDYIDWLETNQIHDAKQTIKVLSKEKVDWIIVDHYSLDQSWETLLKAHTKKLMVIDDLVNRKHNCDLLLNQNLGSLKKNYKNLVPPYCKQIHGSNYILLHQDYHLIKPKLRSFNVKINRIIVYFGNGEESVKYVKSVIEAFQDKNLESISLDIVINTKNSNIQKIKQLISKKRNFKLYSDLPNLAKIMSKSDLGIGAGGSTTWERCFLGLPSILIVTDNNQKSIANSIKKKKAGLVFDSSKNLKEKIIKAVLLLRKQPKLYHQLHKNSLKVCDGQGSKRVAEILQKNIS